MGKWRGGDGDDDTSYSKTVKIRKSNRKTSKNANLREAFEKEEVEWAEKISTGSFAARVVEVHKRYVFVSTEANIGEVKTNDVWLAEVARKFRQASRQERNFVAVGDRVLCTPAMTLEIEISSDLPRCVVEHLAPRTAVIARHDPHNSRLTHVIASNMDQLLIVSSYLHPTIKWGLIDRYLVLAETEKIPAVIVLNKRDLLAAEKDSDFYRQCVFMRDLYKKIGYTVFDLQIHGDQSDLKDPQFEAIRKLLDKKITLLSGHSGVGKSSLVNLFDPEIIQPVEEDSHIFYKGRHTTTFASFIKLGTGGNVIDTPGIRSFTFDDRHARDLAYCFVEFVPYLGKCRYRECHHKEEPDCAIREAVLHGGICEPRYRSYLSILGGASGREGRIRDLDLETMIEEGHD